MLHKHMRNQNHFLCVCVCEHRFPHNHISRLDPLSVIYFCVSASHQKQIRILGPKKTRAEKPDIYLFKLITNTYRIIGKVHV